MHARMPACITLPTCIYCEPRLQTWPGGTSGKAHDTTLLSQWLLTVVQGELREGHDSQLNMSTQYACLCAWCDHEHVLFWWFWSPLRKLLKMDLRFSAGQWKLWIAISKHLGRGNFGFEETKLSVASGIAGTSQWHGWTHLCVNLHALLRCVMITLRLGRVQCLEQLRSFSTVETFQNQTQVAHATRDHAPVLQVLLACIHIPLSSKPWAVPRHFMQDQVDRGSEWILNANCFLQSAISSVLPWKLACVHGCLPPFRLFYLAGRGLDWKSVSADAATHAWNPTGLRNLFMPSMAQVCRVTRRCHAFGIAVRTSTRCLSHYRRRWHAKGWLKARWK